MSAILFDCDRTKSLNLKYSLVFVTYNTEKIRRIFISDYISRYLHNRVESRLCKFFTTVESPHACSEVSP